MLKHLIKCRIQKKKKFIKKIYVTFIKFKFIYQFFLLLLCCFILFDYELVLI